MNELVVMWLALIPGFALGYVGHELAHYVVLAAGGRSPTLSLWPPRAAFVTPQPIPWDVRLAAVAPALTALLLVVSALVVPWRLGVVGWGVIIGACSRLCYLSKEDRALARGQAIVG